MELLRHKNFAEFTEEEKQIVRQAMARLIWQFNAGARAACAAPQSARATSICAHPSAPTRAYGGEIIHLRWRRRKTKPRPLVVICDISGSMDRYSRLFLHFIHSLSQDVRQVEAFAFGTRLTHLTPALRHNDVDTAVDKISHLVVDWSGGTRIGESLKTFNYQWSRRVLGWGATVLIISDGWERGDLDLLDKEMDRLQPQRAPSHLAQPPRRLARLPAPRRRHQDRSALLRRIPAPAQPAQPGAGRLPPRRRHLIRRLPRF